MFGFKNSQIYKKSPPYTSIDCWKSINFLVAGSPHGYVFIKSQAIVPPHIYTFSGVFGTIQKISDLLPQIFTDFEVLWASKILRFGASMYL